jgi:hypothetical protein
MEQSIPIVDAIETVASRLDATAEQAWADIRGQARDGRLSLEGIDNRGRPCPIERYWIPYIERWGIDCSDMPDRDSGSIITFDRERAIRDWRADKKDGRATLSIPPSRVRAVIADSAQINDLWGRAKYEFKNPDWSRVESVRSEEYLSAPLPQSVPPNLHRLVPFGAILGQDDDRALVELIEERWRVGKIPGPVLGRRSDNHIHEEIKEYFRLEILWAAAASRHDYYNGDYDSEAYAVPPLAGRHQVGTDYYQNEWKDLATTEETLDQLKLRKNIRDAYDWHCKPIPVRAELLRLTDALARAREAVRKAIWSREAESGMPRFYVKADRDFENEREHLFDELHAAVTQGKIVAFAVDDDSIGQLPIGDGFWGRTHIRRTFLEDTVSNGRTTATVMVRAIDAEIFTREYLAERGLSQPASTAAAGIQAPGPKGGEQSVDQLAWRLAEQMLDAGQAPRRKHGRLMALAREINAELGRQGHKRHDDSIRKAIGPSLREWEMKHPDK